MSFRYPLFVLLGVVASGAACATSTLPAVPAAAPDSAARAAEGALRPAEPKLMQYIIKGRVQLPSLSLPEGAHVAVYQVLDDGKLAPISGNVTSSDQEGRFVVEVALRETGESDLLVRADSSSGNGFAVVSTALSVDKVIPVRPIDEETTVEAQVYLAAKSAGVWPKGQHAGRLSSLVSPRLAQVALRGRDFSTAVHALARASSAATDVWGNTLQHAAVGVQEDQLKSILTALDWSQYALASGLNTARTEQEADIVRADFLAGIPLAYGLAAIRPHQLVLAAQATASTFELYARDLPGDARAQAWTDMELQRAAFVANTVNELFYQLGDVATRAEARSLSEAMLWHIAHQQGEPTVVKEAIHTAWQHYREAVLQAVQVHTQALNKADWEQAQKALARRADAAHAAFAQLKAGDAPKENAAQAAQIMGQVMADVKAQADTLCVSDKALPLPQVLALLSVVENLDLACE